MSEQDPRPAVCVIHDTELTPDGVCFCCVADQAYAESLSEDEDDA